jgi:hypothetical protein
MAVDRSATGASNNAAVCRRAKQVPLLPALSSLLQMAEAKRMEAKIIVVQSSHMSLLSHPSEIAAVIEDALATVDAI